MKDLAKVSVKNLSINVFYNVKSRSSFSWKYFGHLILSVEGNKKKILKPDHVYCLACLIAVKNESEDITFGSVKIKSYSKTVSTGNLTRHLRDEHQIQPNKAPDFLAKRDKWALARDLALWFARSLLPFDSVSDEGMVDFFKKYNLIIYESDVPSRFTVSGPALSDLYESILTKVKEIISSHAAQHFALTFDLWTDQFRQLNYITFTLHYLTSDFNAMELTLSTEIILGEISSEKINEKIEDIKKRFDLDGKNIMAVTDAGEIVKRAVLLSNMAHHLCLGHALHNLVTVDGLQSIPEVVKVVEKCKNVVKAIKYRAPELQVEGKKTHLNFFGSLDRIVEMLDENHFASIQEDDMRTEIKKEVVDEISPSEMNLVNEDIPIMNSSTPTRWHSVLEMLESVYICNRDPLNNMLRKIDHEVFRITQNEWMLIDDLVKFLKRFQEVVRILSSQNTCSMNLALVFRSEIIDLLNSVQEDESIIILNLKRNMLGNINKRFPVTKEIVAAALLDNRFMTLKEIDVYLDSQNMTRTNFLSLCIREVIDSDYIGETDMATASTSTDNTVETSLLLNKLAKKHSTAYQGNRDDQIKQECWRYIAAPDPTEPKNGDLLSYWNSKRNAFPNIAALAKAILCVPATSTPSERDNYKLWGGCFEEEPSAVLRRLNDSLAVDVQLYREDIRGSIAWAQELHRSGHLSHNDHELIQKGLLKVEQEIEEELSQNVRLCDAEEDIHSLVERRLCKQAGEAALKLHTARSRNDQSATDTKLWMMASLQKMQDEVVRLIDILTTRADKEIDIIIPGYTHLQRAQAIRWSHFLLSYAWMLHDDVIRLSEQTSRLSMCPLGSGAIAGCALSIDRVRLANSLGFAKVTPNSMFGIGSRDHIVEFLNWASLCGLHLSRLSEDLIIYSSQEFGFIQFSDQFSTGSSLMPQKRNPDGLELVRGAAALLLGDAFSFSCTLKGLPSTYNKDLQTDKQILFRSYDKLLDCIKVSSGTIETMTVDAEKGASLLDSGMLATDFAYVLVRRGVPFRRAHHYIGEALKRAKTLNVSLQNMPQEEYLKICPEFGNAEEIQKVFSWEASVEQYTSVGGTARAAVRLQIDQLREWLNTKKYSETFLS